MIDNKKILAVVPARGGSKGIPNKNIRCIQGVPLVTIVANLISKIPLIDRAIVSTDSTKIAKVSKDAGLAVPFLRPKNLSGDFVGDYEVLLHALQTMEEMDKTRYDYIVMLQPTSPLRKVKDVTDSIIKMYKNNYDALWTISETDSKNHPLKQLVTHDDLMSYYDETGKEIIARQQLDTLYHRNGVAYVISRHCLVEQCNIKGDKTGFLIIDDMNISIDTEWDLELVEYILNKAEKSVLELK